MKLVRRLTFSVFLAIGVVFTLDAALSVREHLRLFDADLRRDERLLGRALAQAVERAWQDRGQPYALELVREADDREGNIRIRLVWLDAPAGTSEGPDAPADAIDALRRERAVSHVRDEAEDERLYTYVPLAIPGARPAALELSESLAHERAYLRDRIQRKLVAAGLMALACGLVAWALGVRLVGRPVRRLVEKARRVGEGDFSEPLELRQRDELSELADEMNAMAARLDAANRKAAAESAAHIATLEQLRHADRLTTVGKLASGLAHELGTPLNVVSGRAGMIAAGEASSREEIARNARIIAEQAARMARIVRQLLDFARRRSPEKRSTDVARLAQQSVELLESLAARARVSLRCEGAERAVPVAVDASQLQQALTNLLVNGIQATCAGGQVSLRVSREELEPGAVAGRAPGFYVVLAVADDGEGIAPDRLPAIFDPFFTTKPVGEGTGLGLSVAHGIVEEHGGWIDVRSEPGRGSTFRIWLPGEAS